MLQKFDDWLNSITMYRLVLYCLSVLVVAAFVVSFFGLLRYDIWHLAGSLGLLLTVGYIVKIVLAKAYQLPTNFESSLITILILFFILSVPTGLSSYLGLFVGVLAALVSKYVINWRGAHLFNPAAFGTLVASVTQLTGAAWWVATPSLLPVVVLIGLLILRKTRQFELFTIFALAGLGTLYFNHVNPGLTLLSFPLVFLGTVMLTEPATAPNGRKLKLIYGLIVGLIFGSQLNLGIISSEPHVALLLGNLFAFFVTLRTAHLLRLEKKTKLSPSTYEFAFSSSSKINYRAGQYFAWTLDKVGFDSRGNRRSFTIASSPREDHLKIGIKFYDPGSQFKKTLLNMKQNDSVHVSALSGEFVAPKDLTKKLVFIAGGIGVTPFRSMIKDQVLAKQKRDITLLYFAAGEQEVLYKDVWQEAKNYGVKVIPFTSREILDEQLLQKSAPDFKQRNFYLSGPPFMVRAYKKSLRDLGISASRIQTDYFSGY